MDQSSIFTTSSSSPNHSLSLFSQFKETNARLKSKTRSLIPSKRISLSDVSDQFSALARDLAPFSHSYEAFCHLAAAKTEALIPHSVNNELQHLLQAARSFRDAAMRTDGSFDDKDWEDVHNAISCYRQAMKLCQQSQLPVLHHELGSLFQRIGSWDEAGRSFLDAGSFRHAAAAFIKGKDYYAAIGACESIPQDDRTNDDRVLSFLLKLSANNIHVVKISEPTGQKDQPEKEDRHETSFSHCSERLAHLCPIPSHSSGRHFCTRYRSSVR